MVAAGIRSCQKHTLPDLPYDYNALEPVICAEIMQLHHSKHHQTYVNNLNVAEDKLAEAHAKGNFQLHGFNSIENIDEFHNFFFFFFFFIS